MPEPLEFEWDDGNKTKSLVKHGVTPKESEEVVSSVASIYLDDDKHSGTEIRYIVIGSTLGGRLLIIAFTIRGNLVRIISARDADRAERRLYEETTNTLTI